MSTPRIRTINKAWEELRQIDPDTAISQHFIRTLVINGQVPSKRSGNRYLIDFDKLLQYLAGETQ